MLPKNQLIPITKQEDVWVTIELGDGAILKSKVVITEVFRLMNEDGSWAEHQGNGLPVYGFSHAPMIMRIERLPTNRKDMN